MLVPITYTEEGGVESYAYFFASQQFSMRLIGARIWVPTRPRLQFRRRESQSFVNNAEFISRSRYQAATHGPYFDGQHDNPTSHAWDALIQEVPAVVTIFLEQFAVSSPEGMNVFLTILGDKTRSFTQMKKAVDSFLASTVDADCLARYGVGTSMSRIDQMARAVAPVINELAVACILSIGDVSHP